MADVGRCSGAFARMIASHVRLLQRRLPPAQQPKLLDLTGGRQLPPSHRVGRDLKGRSKSRMKGGLGAGPHTVSTSTSMRNSSLRFVQRSKHVEWQRRHPLLQSAAMSVMRHTARTGSNEPQVSNELAGRQFRIWCAPGRIARSIEMALVETRDLVKRFGSLTAVDHISFSVERGEVVGFLGAERRRKSRPR